MSEHRLNLCTDRDGTVIPNALRPEYSESRKHLSNLYCLPEFASVHVSEPHPVFVQPDLSVFLDVNLRSPWWKRQGVFDWLEQARWVKLNENELQQLGFVSTELCESMHKLQTQFQLEHLIVTQGNAERNSFC